MEESSNQTGNFHHFENTVIDIETDCRNNGFSSEVPPPSVGMVFPTWKDVDVYYKRYGRQEGFRVVRSSGAYKQQGGQTTRERRNYSWKCEFNGKVDRRRRVNGRTQNGDSLTRTPSCVGNNRFSNIKNAASGSKGFENCTKRKEVSPPTEQESYTQDLSSSSTQHVKNPVARKKANNSCEVSANLQPSTDMAMVDQPLIGKLIPNLFMDNRQCDHSPDMNPRFPTLTIFSICHNITLAVIILLIWVTSVSKGIKQFVINRSGLVSAAAIQGEFIAHI
uniref:FAR1 domain-containing protein n=1 Tax=Chenopodium quinoa TaxID=63459 RepID=A0A803LL59_CHEQI